MRADVPNRKTLREGEGWKSKNLEKMDAQNKIIEEKIEVAFVTVVQDEFLILNWIIFPFESLDQTGILSSLGSARVTTDFHRVMCLTFVGFVLAKLKASQVAVQPLNLLQN